ncbi:MAG: hypothetical protein KDH94_03545 [Coxiellaceae bacterium]|nr:hypothetical protein [Coxiellaceae bacterium]
MNKVKRIAVAISAVSVLGVTSASLACSFDSSVISQANADCLSQTADSTFQSNYNKNFYSGEVAGQQFYQSPTKANAVAAKPQAYAQPQPQQTTQSTTNTNNNSNKQSIHWF